jgi:hypothetical protein
MPNTATRTLTSGRLFAACGIWMMGLGLYFIFFRPALLPEDMRFIGVSKEILTATVPGLQRWLGHVFNVLGGFMAATGATTLLLASSYLTGRARGTFVALVVAGSASVVLMSATNFALHSDFRWLLLLPALMWLGGLVCYVQEGRQPAPS